MNTLHVTLATPAALAQQPASWWDDVLGVAYFGIDAPIKTPAAIPFVQVQMKPLNAQAGVFEVWHVKNKAGVLTSGNVGAIQYRHNGDVLFGRIALEDAAALEAVTAQAYDEIFRLMETLDYPHLLRVWNYMADINAEIDVHGAGVERYRQFNAGRQEAFISHQRNVTGSVPSACALGTHRGPLTLYFLASRAPYVAIENPRQVSAYHYPTEYGARSPTFSRANVLQDENVLFVSGTASVVGHRSLHIDDVAAQTREALANIFAVIDEANKTGTVKFAPGQLWYKIYVRHADDLPAVQTAFEQTLDARVPALYLEADVCRSDLLVEIEASSNPCTSV